jgi:hypothetical protein
MQLLADLATMLFGLTQKPAAALNTNTNGLGVDLKDAGVRTNLIVCLGALHANAILSVNVLESDDNTTFVAPADTTNTNTGNFNTGNSNTMVVKSFQRGKRYVRADVALSGTNADALVTAAFVAQPKSGGANNAGYSIAPQS